MTTRTQTSSPFSRLSFIGKGKSSPRVPRRMATDDDYIPYNGPYEEPPRRTQDQSRGSWGDQAYDDEANNVIHELHRRYVPQDPWLDQDGDRKSRPRARTHSGVSGQTVSSGAIDPHRASVGLLRKSASPAQKPPVPSYINLDASGGVGESPAPSARYSARETPTPPKRTSLASIFTFGQSNKRTPVSPSRVPLPTSPPAASPLSNAKYAHVFAIEPERSRSQPSSIYSGSSEHHPSTVSQEVDAYHSYYNFTPAANQFGQLSPPQNATPPPHPYSYGTPKPQISDPRPTAPLLTSPKLKFTAPASQRFVFPQSPPSNGRGPSLKNSASTPNLRKPPSLLSKGKDKWLSAETWCDAVLLPRPRLKVEDAQQILRGGSGRTVSPPGSPVVVDYTAPPDPSRPVGLPSRVLVHSRSMASLNQSDVSQPRSRRDVPVVPPPPLAPTTQTTERAPRPKSFAWDDLALPSPVPSLARVLEEGQILEHQRKKWQMQATGSFQNTRTRSLSRARAKSLSRAAAGKPQQSSLNFLAARSLLGNQDVIPVLPARHMRAGSQGGGSQGHGTATFTTRSSQQHSHSNSLVKTMTKSSQGHSRSESWSRSAIKKAATICYPDGALSPAEERVNGLETALRRGDTKVIRLADPALLPADPSAALTVRYGGISPTPSGTSDGHMGIAISTPPPPATETSSLEREPLRLPSHPYAQNGTSASYSYHQASTSISKSGADYAGPHPAITVAHVEPQDVVTRHRLPPQAKTTAPTSMQHPYASKRDSYAAIQTQPRLDSDVPGPSKMWAQLAPGVVREILPDEIQYSPFMPNSGMMPPEGEEELESEADLEEQEQDDAQEVYIPTRKRKSTVTILDTVGLGETLAYAIEEEQKQHRDSGLGTSEEHAPDDDGQAVAIETHHPYRIQRKPVQYEFLNTPQTPKKSTIHTTHTAESSLIDPTVEHEHHRLTPPTPPLPSRSANDASPVGTSSGSSPARSPPHIGSVDDLDEFRDLFFKPNLTEEALNNLSRPSSERYPSVAWDSSSVARTQRTTGTGLTTLARQLSAEFSELRAMRRQIGSIGSDSSISRFSGFPRESDIQFIFTESEMGRSIMLDDAASGARPLPSENLSAFHATTRLPEDVESSRASSIIEGSLEQDDENESFRVRSVESSTPAASPGENRSSFTGQLAFIEETTPPTEGVPIPRIPSLHPPSADPTRSSYMTNSTLSRISNLSDFPEPPPNSHPPHNLTPAHMSLLNSYFGGESVPEQSEEEQSAVSVPFTPRLGERF